MRMSENGRRHLAQWEGMRTHEYNDVAGFPTIGVGHLLTEEEKRSRTIKIGDADVPFDNGLSEQQVLDLLAQDITIYEDAVGRHVDAALTQNQFDALVSFTFNVGEAQFAESSPLRAINEQRFEDVPAGLRLWTKAGGVKVQGLVNRREAEIELWLGGDSEIQAQPSRQLSEILGRDEPTPAGRILGAVKSFFTICADPANDAIVRAAIDDPAGNEEVSSALTALRNEIRAMADAGQLITPEPSLAADALFGAVVQTGRSILQAPDRESYASSGFAVIGGFLADLMPEPATV